jgi:predicted nucleic acid-binding Zn ribbon protein
MEQVGSALQRIMAQTLQRLPAEQLPQAAWDFAAGRAVAEKSRVLAVEQGILQVEVPDATWRSQLEAMRPQLLHRLGQVMRIEGIEFHTAAPR